MRRHFGTVGTMTLWIGSLLWGAGIIAASPAVSDPPAYDSDLILTPEQIPDDQNAYTYFRKAMQKMDWPEAERRRLEEFMADGKGDAAKAQELLERNRETLALFDHAMAMEQFQFPDPMRVQEAWLQWKYLSQIARLRIAVASFTGDQKEALRQATRLVRFGYRIQRAHGPIMAHIMGRHAICLGTEPILRVLAGDGLAAEDLQACLKELGACPPDGKGFAESLRIEYTLQVTYVGHLVGAAVTAHTLARTTPNQMPLGLPWFLYDLNRTRKAMADYMRPEVENATRLYSEVRHRPLPYNSSEHGSFERYGMSSFASQEGRSEFLALLAVLVWQTGQENACRERARFRATHTLIAMKAFKVKTGRLPRALAELVPDYLATVPIDDMDGKPLRYFPDRLVLYSVGEDLKDDGGTENSDMVFTIRF